MLYCFYFINFLIVGGVRTSAQNSNRNSGFIGVFSQLNLFGQVCVDSIGGGLGGVKGYCYTIISPLTSNWLEPALLPHIVCLTLTVVVLRVIIMTS